MQYTMSRDARIVFAMFFLFYLGIVGFTFFIEYQRFNQWQYFSQHSHVAEVRVLETDCRPKFHSARVRWEFQGKEWETWSSANDVCGNQQQPVLLQRRVLEQPLMAASEERMALELEWKLGFPCVLAIVLLVMLINFTHEHLLQPRAAKPAPASGSQA